MTEFNRKWLHLVLEYKDNPDVTFDLSQNDVRILLTYIEVLQSKIDKAIEWIEQYEKQIGTLGETSKSIVLTDDVVIGNLLDILKENK